MKTETVAGWAVVLVGFGFVSCMAFDAYDALRGVVPWPERLRGWWRAAA